MSTLSEAELHVQAMRLVCEALQDREQDGLEVDWDVIRQMHDQMDAMLQALQHKHRYDSSEIVDLRKDRDHWKQARDTAIEGGELLLKSNQTLQAEIETLRKELDAARAETVDVRRRLNDETDRHRATHAEKIELFQQKESASKHNADLQQQLDAANAAWNLQCAGIERLQAFVGKVRKVYSSAHPHNWMSLLRPALAELDAGTEPAPVAEPLDAEGGACPGT